MRLRHWVFTIKKNGIEEAMHYYREEVKAFTQLFTLEN